MANRRTLKKAIRIMGEDLLVELMAAQQMNSKIPQADIENVAQSILRMQTDFISRLSHVDKRQVKRFFAQLNDDLNVCTNEIIDHICHLL